MKQAGIVLDTYKLEVFKKHLDAAGYKYEQKPGISPDTITLMVEYEWASDLQPIVEKANTEARKLRQPNAR